MSLREILSPEVCTQLSAWEDTHRRPDTYLLNCPGRSDYELCVKIIDSKEKVIATNFFKTTVNADNWLNKVVEDMNAET